MQTRLKFSFLLLLWRCRVGGEKDVGLSDVLVSISLRLSWGLWWTEASLPNILSLLSHQMFIFFYFCYSFSLTLSWLFIKPFIYIQHPVSQMFFIASLESSSPAVRADTGFWFVWKLWSTDLSDPSVWCQGLLGDWDFVWPTRWRKRSLCWRSH